MILPSPAPKLGIIAGSGDLPERIIATIAHSKRELFVIAFEGETNAPSIENVPHIRLHLGSIGKIISKLRSEGVKEVVLAGRVGRPNLSDLKLDFGGIRLLARIRKASVYGDNAIFSTIVSYLEELGFNVVGVEQLLENLLATSGEMGTTIPDNVAQHDITIGAKVAAAIGTLDIGQAVIVQQGVVLGVEAVEGTDALMKRCAFLQREGKGGVLVKMKKPMQDSRIDLPAIGVTTIENAHAAGLRGIAIQSGGALVIDKEKVIEKANSLGLFLVGI